MCIKLTKIRPKSKFTGKNAAGRVDAVSIFKKCPKSEIMRVKDLKYNFNS